MDLARSLGLRHQRHSRETVYFAGFDQHQVDNLCLRRAMIYEAVMAGKDGSCRWHKGQEGDVGGNRSVADFPQMEMSYNIRWLPSWGSWKNLSIAVIVFAWIKGGQGRSALVSTSATTA